MIAAIEERRAAEAEKARQVQEEADMLARLEEERIEAENLAAQEAAMVAAIIEERRKAEAEKARLHEKARVARERLIAMLAKRSMVIISLGSFVIIVKDVSILELPVKVQEADALLAIGEPSIVEPEPSCCVEDVQGSVEDEEAHDEDRERVVRKEQTMQERLARRTRARLEREETAEESVSYGGFTASLELPECGRGRYIVGQESKSAAFMFTSNKTLGVEDCLSVRG
ncbi:hypothetical protein M408DRAFT_9508 [Serendipita vermifera MAFF 305830]|uniref:Uncharacterized protein n=1 Tax=Serendipita vermifera MAFF 305830 TaxID=933852 RepID=A0A0C2WLE3_SERVB|nr:hypothetical protein M408DRAFT_9508 [Serendipita vermifera MAFF 305830]